MTIEQQKILIAEDNQVMADVLRFNLERAGYNVTISCSGREALDCLVKESFDLLVTDYQMPHLNGDELCRQLRQDERHREMKIIMCSAKGYELDIDALQKELDIFQIIFKPFSPVQMKQIVAEALAVQPTSA